MLYFVPTHQVMCAIASIRTFIAEREIAGHELRTNLYRLPAYFAARSAAEASVHVLFSCLFSLLTYYLVGLAPTTYQLGGFMAVVLLVTLCAESYVILVGAVMPDDKSAAVVGPLFLALFMVSGGLFVNTAKVPPLFRLFNRGNPFVYAFDALMQIEMANLTFTCQPDELIGPPPLTAAQLKLARSIGASWPEPRCPVQSGDEVLQRMALAEWSVPADCAALCLMIVVYRLLALAALRRRFRSS